MAAVTPLPRAPEVALGAINLGGDPIPVLDIRRRLGFRSRDYGLSGRLLIATTCRRRLALPVDDVLGVEEFAVGSVSPPQELLPGLRDVAGIVALSDGLLLIHDLEAFLFPEEEERLDEALGRTNAGASSEA